MHYTFQHHPASRLIHVEEILSRDVRAAVPRMTDDPYPQQPGGER